MNIVGPLSLVVDCSLKIQASPGKGRGVFANSDIAAGTTILCEPAERYSGEDALYLEKHHIYDHFFVDPVQYGTEERSDILWVIGLISVVNHDDVRICVIQWKTSELGEWAAMVSLREITAGDELFISYTNIDEYDFSGGMNQTLLMSTPKLKEG